MFFDRATGSPNLQLSTGNASGVNFKLSNSANEWRWNVRGSGDFRLRDITGGAAPFYVDAGIGGTVVDLTTTGYVANTAAIDYDFTINKNTSGQALVYDAGDDDFEFGSEAFINLNGSSSKPALAIGVSNWGFWRSATQGLKVGIGGTELLTFGHIADDVEFHVPAVNNGAFEEGAFQALSSVNGATTATDLVGFKSVPTARSFTSNNTSTVGLSSFKSMFTIASGVLGVRTITGTAGFFDCPNFSGASNKIFTNYYGAYFADGTAKTTATITNQYGIAIS